MSEKKEKIQIPDYTRGEEIFNMVSHIAGGGLGVVCLALCVVFGAIHRDAWAVVGGAVYGATLVLLYVMSSVYHGLFPYLKAKKVFRVLDHCTIYLLIAGTYTPVMLAGVRDRHPVIAWTAFGIVWGAAALAITLTAVDLHKFRILSMICYLAMGWCVVFFFRETLEALGWKWMIFLIIGGVLYTAGAVLYLVGKKKKIRYMHSVFHLFVVAASLFHFFAVFFALMV